MNGTTLTIAACAACGVIALGCAILVADALLSDRIRIARQVRRFRRDMEAHLAAVAQLENMIADAKRRLRDCHGDAGDET